VTSQSLWPLYDHHFVGITRYNALDSNGEDLSCYSKKIESVTNKAYLSAITVANICKSFYLQDGGKINWRRYGTKLRHCHPVYTLFCDDIALH